MFFNYSYTSDCLNVNVNCFCRNYLLNKHFSAKLRKRFVSATASASTIPVVGTAGSKQAVTSPPWRANVPMGKRGRAPWINKGIIVAPVAIAIFATPSRYGLNVPSRLRWPSMDMYSVWFGDCRRKAQAVLTACRVCHFIPGQTGIAPVSGAAPWWCAPQKNI